MYYIEVTHVGFAAPISMPLSSAIVVPGTPAWNNTPPPSPTVSPSVYAPSPVPNPPVPAPAPSISPTPAPAVLACPPVQMNVVIICHIQTHPFSLLLRRSRLVLLPIFPATAQLHHRQLHCFRIHPPLHLL